MPQVTFAPLPVLQEGEGLEGENVFHNEVTISIVDGENSWIEVQRKKKNRKKKDNCDGKQNKQQKQNFVCFGDIWYQEP